MSDLRMCPYTDCGTYAICPHHAPLSCGREAGTIVSTSVGNVPHLGTDEVTSMPPNPGSDEALALGCTCPVMDNHHGAGLDYPNGPAFWVKGRCPLHGNDHALLRSGMTSEPSHVESESRVDNGITDAPDDSCPQCSNALDGYDHGMCSINEDREER